MSILFSKNLKKLRKEAGVTQKELAEDLQVSQATVFQWETGCEPNMNMLERIADYFNASLDQLFGCSDIPKNRVKTEDEKIMLSTFVKLNNANKAKLLGFALGLLEAQPDFDTKKS